MILRCCWRGLSPALLATPEGVNSSRSCSCQLSNSINKKVDGPHRGCTYGPKGLCRLSQGLSNYENNIHKQCGIVKQYKFRHFRKQKSDLQNCEPLYFYKQKCKERAFPTLVAMRTKQQVVKCCPPTSWVGLYCKATRAHLRHTRVALATKPRFASLVPKGSQSLTQKR